MEDHDEPVQDASLPQLPWLHYRDPGWQFLVEVLFSKRIWHAPQLRKYTLEGCDGAAIFDP